MITVIMHRENHTHQDYDFEVLGHVDSRVEIVWAETYAKVIEKAKQILESMAEEALKQGCDGPEYTVLIDGVPLDDFEGLYDESVDSIPSDLANIYLRILKRLREEKERAEKEEELAKERKERSKKELQERNELARLMAKYGSK